ncbi:MAG: hypothetical protein U0T77_04010 [Chitinophagales bacterium]
MKTPISRLIAFWGAIFTPFSTFAHPGHGETDGYSIIHYMVEPVHVVASFSLISVVALAYYAISRNKKGNLKVK